jgi:hypothetical protein
MDFEPNPPWVDRVLYKHWHELEAKVGEDMMPSFGKEARGGKRPARTKAGYTEYGCGHYGCVLATNAEDIVCKATSDASEIRLVTTLLEKGIPAPEGMVKYHAIAVVDEKHRGRPVAVIWRQEAFDVGNILAWGNKTARPHEWKDTKMTLRFTQILSSVAGIVRGSLIASKAPEKVIEQLKRPRLMESMFEFATSVVDWGDDASIDWYPIVAKIDRLTPKTRVPAAVSVYKMALVMMENDNAISAWIANAFRELLTHGILLADVHINNIGRSFPHTDEYAKATLHWVITDPGHAVFLGEGVLDD